MQMPTAIEGESYWEAKIIMPYIYLWGLRDYRTLSSLKQTERKKKACGCNHFQTERLHLERNVGSRKTVEIIFSPHGGLYCAIYLVKGKQLFAGEALLLSSSVLPPELGAGWVC